MPRGRPPGSLSYGYWHTPCPNLSAFTTALPAVTFLRDRSDDARSIQRPGYSAAAGWAGRSSRWPIAKISAEEHHDAVAHVTLTEMDVGLCYRRT